MRRTETIVLGLLLLLATVHAQTAKRQCAEGSAPDSKNSELIEDYGSIGYPLRGWVGYTNTGDPVSGMTIECFSDDRKHLLYSTTTDAKGAFLLPKLQPGTYFLKGTAKGVSTIQGFFRASRRSSAIACLITEAEADNP